MLLTNYRITAPVPLDFTLRSIHWKIEMRFDHAGRYWSCAVTRPTRLMIAVETSKEELFQSVCVRGTPILHDTILECIFRRLVTLGLAEVITAESTFSHGVTGEDVVGQ